MKEILLSIITVCYNSEKTIGKTLESIGTQLTDEVEYLIVDGESKDQTLSLIADAQKKYPIRLVSEKDKGIYDAMNKGIALAKGRWLLFINSDDCLKPGIVEKMIPVLKEAVSVGCICSDVEMVRFVEGRRYSKIWVCETVDSRIKWYMTGSHQGLYMQKAAVEKLGGFDIQFKIVADWELLYRIYSAGYEIRYVHEVTSEFLEGGASQKQMVWEKHLVRKKNRMYRVLDLGLIRDGAKRFKSEMASLLLGKKKALIVAKRRYKRLK